MPCCVCLYPFNLLLQYLDRPVVPQLKDVLEGCGDVGRTAIPATSPRRQPNCQPLFCNNYCQPPLFGNHIQRTHSTAATSACKTHSAPMYPRGLHSQTGLFELNPARPSWRSVVPILRTSALHYVTILRQPPRPPRSPWIFSIMIAQIVDQLV